MPCSVCSVSLVRRFLCSLLGPKYKATAAQVCNIRSRSQRLFHTRSALSIRPSRKRTSHGLNVANVQPLSSIDDIYLTSRNPRVGNGLLPHDHDQNASNTTHNKVFSRGSLRSQGAIYSSDGMPEQGTTEMIPESVGPKEMIEFDEPEIKLVNHKSDDHPHTSESSNYAQKKYFKPTVELTASNNQRPVTLRTRPPELYNDAKLSPTSEQVNPSYIVNTQMNTSAIKTRSQGAKHKVQSKIRGSHRILQSKSPPNDQGAYATLPARERSQRAKASSTMMKDPSLLSASSSVPRQREHWQVQKNALTEKFGSQGWNPRKRLSPDALEGIRALHAQYPTKYTTPTLADQFKVSPEAIRRILKSKWRPDDEEAADRRQRWDRRGEGIWSQMVEIGIKPPKKWREMGVRKGSEFPPLERSRRASRDPHSFRESWGYQEDNTGNSNKRRHDPVQKLSLSDRIL
ncbi:Required for respiratory growth protein 9 mitochondrial [Lignoscripta atroalba]|nr:Required for respiratory growth protein 9 mitochondrial [Lignoscripta atroalba]